MRLAEKGQLAGEPNVDVCHYFSGSGLSSKNLKLTVFWIGPPSGQETSAETLSPYFFGASLEASHLRA